MGKIKLLLLPIGALFIAQVNAVFTCDKQASIAMIYSAKKISYRHDAKNTIVYTFSEDWHNLTKENKYQITRGLGEAELCVNEGVYSVLFFAEKNAVAKYNKAGTTHVYEYE